MRLAFPRSLRPGWLAVHSQQAALTLVHATRGPDGIVVDLCRELDGGERAPEALPALRKSLGLEKFRCTTLLPVGNYQLIQTETPDVPREEWREALRWRLKDLLDYPAEEAVFDVADIPTEQYAPGRQRQCLVVAARRSQVLDHVQPLLSARLQLEAVDVAEMAQRNVAALFEEENRGLAFLAFDDSGGLLTVSFKGELYVSRHIDVYPAQMAGADDERRQQMFERVALEAQRTLDTFDRQYSFMTITRLKVALWPELAGMLESLRSSLYIPVDEVDLAEHMDLTACPELAQKATQARLIYAIGAALRDGDTA